MIDILNFLFLEHTSRFLNPKDYLFDIINEYLQSNKLDFHFTMKRILWFNIPLTFSHDNQSDIFINLIYHQLVSDLLEGTMIIFDANHLSDQLMVKKRNMMI